MFYSGIRACHARSAPVVLVLAILISCSPSKPAGVERLAILRFENLTGDDSSNWMGRAIPEVMTAELLVSRTVSVIPFRMLHASDRVLGPRPLSAPGISTEQQAALLAGAHEILYGRISRFGTRLRLDAELFDTSRGKIERALAVSGLESQGVVALAGALVKQFAAPTRGFATKSDTALREYSKGLESEDPAASATFFANAVAADPNFGPAYVAWAERAAEQGNRAAVEKITALATGRDSSISELDRARLGALAAELHGDVKATVQALKAASRLDPTDLQLLTRLAHVNLTVRRYTEAAQAFRAAVTIEPQNIALLNELGYAEMYAGNLRAATAALEEYRRLQPADANAPDSLGDANFYLGQFSDAEHFYRESFAKDPTFNSGGALLKAAHARLRTGDITGADAIFKEYLEARRKANDQSVELRYAEWEFDSGRRQAAIARLGSLARSLPAGAASQVNAQIAVWLLELGDRKRARDLAEQSQGGPIAAIAHFLTETPAPVSEWKSRALGFLPNAGEESTRQLLIGCALLLEKNFASALPVLEDAYQHSAPEPREILPVLVAWAQVETGHFNEAAPLILRNPVPNPTPELFASLAFPRLLFLRATVLEKQGQRSEAEKSFQLFATLSRPAGTR